MRRDVNGVGNLPWLAVAGEDDTDILIVEHTEVGLAQLQCLGQRLVAGHLDQPSLFQSRNHLAVHHQLGTLRIGLVEEAEAIGHVGTDLRGVGEFQHIVGSRSAGDVAHHGHIHIDFRHLDLHSGLHQHVLAWLVVLRADLALVGSTGLTTTGAEDGTELAVFIDIDRDGIVVAVL